jgi:DNA polymerase III epsilon subunit-like protein
MNIQEFKKPFIMVYDTETNGLPKNWNGSIEDTDNWPRLSQLSYQIHDVDGNLIKTFNHYIKPEGWVFPNEEFFNKNSDINININEGIELKDALNEFISDRLICEFAVCHNVNFDSKVIRSEMFRMDIKQEFESVKICTMSNAFVTSFCGLPKKTGGFGKWPTLDELHNVLFKCSFEGAHNSSSDVAATTKCFFELLRLKIIDIDKEKLKHNEKIAKFKESKQTFDL